MSEVSPDAVASRLIADRAWRLSNLYRIKNKAGVEVTYSPNWAQQQAIDQLRRRNIELKVRQLGVTTGYCMLWLDTCLFRSGVSVGIVAHTKDDAAIIFRDKIKYAYDRLPPEIRAAVPSVKADAHELILANGSSIRVGVTFRSGTVQILHVTEYGYICQREQQRAEEVKTGAMQAVPHDGIIVIESTAKGRAGHFYDLCQESQRGGASEWRFSFLPWWKEPSYEIDEPTHEYKAETEYLDKLEKITGKLLRPKRQWWIRKHRELGEDMYAEYPSTPEEAFKQSTEGAYYGSLMLQAWQKGHITSVPVERGLQVETWWDLGMNDETFIWFMQRYGYELRAVDCYANSGEGLGHYANYLREWREKNHVNYSRHVAPHDIKVRELNTGKTRLETAAGLGIVFEVAPMLPIIDGIEAVRVALPRVVFDEERCAEGIRALEGYRKSWNEALGVYRNQPLHDQFSHAADAFRTGIVGGEPSIAVSGPSRVAKREVRREVWR